MLELPFDDVWVVIVESHSVCLTSAVLSRIVDAGIGVMTCGDDHMPNGLLLPIRAHSRHAAIVEDQLAMGPILRRRLWQAIVRAKVSNQAEVLELLGMDSRRLRAYADDVRSDDSTGREACAAREYFRALISEGTRRDGPLTPALDYGYAVLRAGVAREAVGGGWLVSRGIHHCSDLNAFNLVDDLMEPFRAVVDLMVMTYGITGDLTHEAKALLASVSDHRVLCSGRKLTVQAAIGETLASLRDAVLGEDASRLSLPSVIPLERAVPSY